MDEPTTGTIFDCEKYGHCLHPGTAVGSLWCCRCGQYIQELYERLNYYEDIG